MKAVGVIVEYNPFHNGHKYHLERAKETSGASIVIAVMSGNFLQRGEPALLSKWARTEMALLGGVDLVFELPYRFATQNADIFAGGAVSILEAARCDSLCFGSESGDLQTFTNTLSFLDENEESFHKSVKEYSGQGVSYPKAVSLSFDSLADNNQLLDLTKPNNSLGLQYVSAIKKQQASIKAMTITRKNAQYHDDQFSSNTIASATSIRKALFTNVSGVHSYLPHTSYHLLLKYKKDYGQFHSWENYWPLLRYKLLQCQRNELKEYHEVEEGIENRLFNAAIHADSFQTFMKIVKTKRYTWTRLQRVCLHLLMNIKREEMIKTEKADYLRLLGMTKAGREYLHMNKNHFTLPVISKVSANSDLLELDIRASRMYSLGLPIEKQNELLKLEFSQPPIYI
ncbi:nucleotidyltransferase [Bacillus sp. B15-48]|uniref:nucleotidyltransferase n=1 Tax=Bacillus sp. B15-48 TaxID=1548601 RepID=UPI00193F2F55|nr:nucleotidyltransferase [Bacillus sp. B15-48]MBM4764046.1 nucleotidyltransferase [Bacillus sp. B15-48]